MAKLKKKWATFAAVFALVLISAGPVGSIFMGPFRKLGDEVARAERILEEGRSLLSKKHALEAEWLAKKDFFNIGMVPDAALSQWVKDLLMSAQSQALVLEKLEPAGIRTGPGRKDITVFVSFQGDIRQLVRFVYQLKEKDPLSRIESLDARRQESSQGFSFELLLAKTVQ